MWLFQSNRINKLIRMHVKGTRAAPLLNQQRRLVLNSQTVRAIKNRTVWCNLYLPPAVCTQYKAQGLNSITYSNINTTFIIPPIIRWSLTSLFPSVPIFFCVSLTHTHFLFLYPALTSPFANLSLLHRRSFCLAQSFSFSRYHTLNIKQLVVQKLYKSDRYNWQLLCNERL